MSAIGDSMCVCMCVYSWIHTKSEVAETALSSEVFALASICDVVTRRKFVRFVGSAVQTDAVAMARETKEEKRIISCRKKKNIIGGNVELGNLLKRNG